MYLSKTSHYDLRYCKSVAENSCNKNCKQNSEFPQRSSKEIPITYQNITEFFPNFKTATVTPKLLKNRTSFNH